MFPTKSIVLGWFLILYNNCLISSANLVQNNSTDSFKCQSPTLKLCECGLRNNYTNFDRPVYVVKCIDQKFTNTSVLEDLPLETEVLVFTGNNIPELPPNIFGSSLKYTNLTVIDLSNNNINLIHGKTFHHVEKVERLILNSNNLFPSKDNYHPRILSNFIFLRELHLTNAFADNTPENLALFLQDMFVKSNLNLLEKIHLEQNEISIFHNASIFCDLQNLLHLYLGDNCLKGIHFDLYCMKKINYLDLERNKIAILKKDDLDMLDAVSKRTNYFTVEVSNNPFLCTCDDADAVYFYNWINLTKVIFRHKINTICNMDCVFHKSGTLDNKIHNGVSKSDILHKDIKHSTQNVSNDIEDTVKEKVSNESEPNMIFSGLCILLVGLVILLCVGKRILARFSSSLDVRVDTISRKVQYTSLSRTAHHNSETDL